MITLKEIFALALAVIILAFSNSFIDTTLFITSLIFFSIIVLVYAFSKKAMAWYLECKEEIKILSFQRYGWYERSYLKMPIPIGLILPFVLSILSLGWVKWFAVLESEIQGTSARAVRRHDFYSYSELTEWHIALISAAGILAMFVLAIAAYLVNYAELSKLAIFYAAFNMIPLGKIDGLKVFFGSRALYTILIILVFVGLVYAFFLP